MGTVLDPAITIPDTYADRLLRQAEYHILGPVGAFRSGRSVDIFNLAPTRWGKWGKSVIRGSNPNSVWTPGEVGHAVVQLDGVDQFIELPQDLMSSRRAGTTMMVFKGPSAGVIAYRLLSDANPWGTQNIEQDINSLQLFAGDTFQSNDPLQSEVWPLARGFVPNTWFLVGYEWGPAGKRIFANGALAAEDETKRNGTNASPAGTLTIGRADHSGTIIYSKISVAFFAFWTMQLGEPAHRAIQEARRPGH